MATKPGCTYTHSFLIAGTCPWCGAPVVDGVVRPDVAPKDAAVRRWNIEAMLKALDSADKGTRTWVSRNLLCHGPKDLAALPVYRKAMHARDEEVRSLTSNALSRWGNADLAARYLPRLASHTVGAYALSEASSGSDAFALETRAFPREGGYALSGRKLWVTAQP